MATPKLRFKEFNNDLDVESLNDIVVFSKGKGLSKADISSDGKNPCIRYGELYTTYGQVIDNIISKTNIKKSDCILSQAGDVIIPASGETQIDIATAACVLHDGIILSGDLNILSHKENGAWLAYYLSSAKKLEMARFAQGNSVVHLYSRQLKDIKINKPSLKEQTKIATFLSAVDTKIDELTQKHELLTEYKKGMMQQIFSQKLRFQADDGSDFEDWEYMSLHEVLDYEQPTRYIVKTTDYDDSFKTAVLTAGKSFILGYTNEDNDIFEADNKNVIIFDDFTTAYKFVDFPFKVKSSAMKILQTKSKNYDIFYIYSVFSTINIQKGDEHKRRWISEYSQIEVPIPSLPEQTKIANFLTAIDQKIDNVAEQIDHAKTWKKGLLQQMFV
jgi:type I restriction enzyme S subunit